MTESIYDDGVYRHNNPDWHSADSRWKAERIAGILARNSVQFARCAEVGCGAGQILTHLAAQMPERTFAGYDISPDAARLWRSAQVASVSYHLGDFGATTEYWDLLLVIDVFEHVEDYMGFLRRLANRARWFVFHIPLDMHLSALLRDRQLHARQQVGHLHYFSRATALATLVDTGYRIIDQEFTKLAQQTTEGRRAITRVANLGRLMLHALSPDLAAKLLGGYSLLVLCQANDAHVGSN